MLNKTFFLYGQAQDFMIMTNSQVSLALKNLKIVCRIKNDVQVLVWMAGEGKLIQMPIALEVWHHQPQEEI